MFLGAPENGRVALEHAGMRTRISPFSDAKVFVDRIDQLARAWRVSDPAPCGRGPAV